MFATTLKYTNVVALATILPLLHSATAAPVERTVALSAFADAFISACTAGSVSSCSSISSALNVDVSAGITWGEDVTAWATNQCYSAYQDTAFCAQAGAYVAAAFYGDIQGWAGADLFVSLGDTRINEWQGFIGTLCGKSNCPSDKCSSLKTYFSGYSSATASATISAAVGLEALTNVGVINLIDASSCECHSGSGSSSGTSVSSPGLLGIGAEINGLLDLGTGIEAGVSADIGINLVKKHGGVTTIVDTGLAAKIEAEAEAIVGAKIVKKDHGVASDLLDVDLVADVEAEADIATGLSLGGLL